MPTASAACPTAFRRANSRAALSALALAMVVLALPSRTEASTWPQPAGSTYAELVGYWLQSSRVTVPGVREVESSPRARTANLRLFAQSYLSRRLVVSLNVRLVDHYAFDEATTTRFGEPEFGARWVAWQGQRASVAPWIRLQIPTSSDAVVIPNDDPEWAPVAATGAWRPAIGLEWTGRRGDNWLDASVGFRGWIAGDDPAPESFDASHFVGAANWWRAWGRSAHWETSLGLIWEVRTSGTADQEADADVDSSGASATGNLPQAQYVGFLGRADYRFANGFGVGLGVDGAFWFIGYPSAPSAIARLSWQGGR